MLYFLYVKRTHLGAPGACCGLQIIAKPFSVSDAQVKVNYRPDASASRRNVPTGAAV